VFPKRYASKDALPSCTAIRRTGNAETKKAAAYAAALDG